MVNKARKAIMIGLFGGAFLTVLYASCRLN